MLEHEQRQQGNMYSIKVIYTRIRYNLLENTSSTVISEKNKQCLKHNEETKVKLGLTISFVKASLFPKIIVIPC